MHSSSDSRLDHWSFQDVLAEPSANSFSEDGLTGALSLARQTNILDLNPLVFQARDKQSKSPLATEWDGIDFSELFPHSEASSSTNSPENSSIQFLTPQDSSSLYLPDMGSPRGGESFNEMGLLVNHPFPPLDDLRSPSSSIWPAQEADFLESNHPGADTISPSVYNTSARYPGLIGSEGISPGGHKRKRSGNNIFSASKKTLKRPTPIHTGKSSTLSRIPGLEDTSSSSIFGGSLVVPSSTPTSLSPLGMCGGSDFSVDLLSLDAPACWPSSAAEPSAPEKEKKIPRPPNAFILFRSHYVRIIHLPSDIGPEKSLAKTVGWCFVSLFGWITTHSAI